MAKTGLADQLIDRVRKDDMRNDDELRASLRNLGWLDQLPAIMDERGQVLVGSRRLRIAGELGIRAVVRTVSFGSGDMADAGRVALSIASNLGAKPMSNRDRQRLSLYLFQEREWSIERIAQALNTGLSKIKRDLRQPGAAKDGPRRQRDAKPMPGHDKAREAVRPLVERGEQIPRDELATRLGVSPGTVQRAEIAERAALEARTDPIIDPKTLPKTAQEKLEMAERQMRKRLEREFDERVSKGVQEMLDTVLPKLKARENAANRTLRARRGILQRESYRLILSCLHPDSRSNVSDAKLAEAFQVFKELEMTLVAEKELATAGAEIPGSYSDLMAMRRRSKNGAGAKP